MLSRKNRSINRRSVMVTFGAVALALLMAPGQGWADFQRTSYLTFSHPVALPGVVLLPGTYAFRIANSHSSRDIVVVTSRNGLRSHFVGLTQSVLRPAGMSPRQVVSLGEAAAGAPAPITVWYPADAPDGRRFLYR